MSQRLLRVQELIKRELSTVLERHFTYPGALVTIHAVDMTPDLKQCFIYTGVLTSKDVEGYIVIRKMNELHGMFQRELYKRVKLKFSPTLHFKIDNSVERGVRVLQAIDDLPEPLSDEEPELEPGAEGESESRS